MIHEKVQDHGGYERLDGRIAELRLRMMEDLKVLLGLKEHVPQVQKNVTNNPTRDTYIHSYKGGLAYDDAKGSRSLEKFDWTTDRKVNRETETGMLVYMCKQKEQVTWKYADNWNPELMPLGEASYPFGPPGQSTLNFDVCRACGKEAKGPNTRQRVRPPDSDDWGAFTDLTDLPNVCGNGDCPGYKPEGRCFPGASILSLECGNDACIRDIKVGDMVRTGETFEPVLLFSHFDDASKSVPYVCIDLAHKDVSPRRLVCLILTAEHAVPLYNGGVASAAEVRCGDLLISSEGLPLTVKHVSVTRCDGIFCVKTPSGEVCVNGVVCKCGQKKPDFQERLLLSDYDSQQHFQTSVFSTWSVMWRPLIMNKIRRLSFEILGYAWKHSHGLGMRCSAIAQRIWVKRMPEMFVLEEDKYLPMLR